jgi:hypothetical protein
VLALAIFAVTPLAQAATSRYAGKVKNGGPVSFQVSGSSLKRLQASVSVSCVSVAPARSGIDIHIVAQIGLPGSDVTASSEPSSPLS